MTECDDEMIKGWKSENDYKDDMTNDVTRESELLQKDRDMVTDRTCSGDHRKLTQSPTTDKH